MSDNRKTPPEKEAERLKNPSPIGCQQNPVSNPAETTNPVEKELAERKKFHREQEAREQTER